MAQRLREQVRQLERQREEEQVDRAAVINALSQRLEESQQQCAKLLQTGVCLSVNVIFLCNVNSDENQSVNSDQNLSIMDECFFFILPLKGV